MRDFRIGDHVTTPTLTAWSGQTGFIQGNADSPYDWVIDFNGSPVPTYERELRHVEES